MATKKIKRFQEGGMSDKDRGLEASKDEKVGFFERLRMGNIDEEGSEAYRRFGAGRGKASRTPVEDRVATPVGQAASAAPAEMDDMEAANARAPIPVPAGPRAVSSAPARAAPARPAPAKSPAMQEQSYRRTGGASADDMTIFCGQDLFRTYTIALKDANQFHYSIDVKADSEFILPGTSINSITNFLSSLICFIFPFS